MNNWKHLWCVYGKPLLIQRKKNKKRWLMRGWGLDSNRMRDWWDPIRITMMLHTNTEAGRPEQWKQYKNGSNNTDNKHTEDCVYLGESLADVKQRWSGNWVSEVWGGKQQGRHLQVDKLETQKQTYCNCTCHIQRKERETNILIWHQAQPSFFKIFVLTFLPWVLPLRLHTFCPTLLVEVIGSWEENYRHYPKISTLSACVSGKNASICSEYVNTALSILLFFLTSLCPHPTTETKPVPMTKSNYESKHTVKEITLKPEGRMATGLDL